MQRSFWILNTIRGSHEQEIAFNRFYNDAYDLYTGTNTLKFYRKLINMAKLLLAARFRLSWIISVHWDWANAKAAPA